MARYVLKFGGTSVANTTRLEHVAEIVKQEIETGNQIAVVVSAMAGSTNELVGYTHSLCPHQTTLEHDVVLAAGEQITSGLLALALQGLGLRARSFLSWQIPIQTDDSPSHARILDIQTTELEKCFKNNIVPVVAGFQGVTKDGRITTLGRGGSDTTAVALAAALSADRCDIYTDVDGVYTADPRLVSKASKLTSITYEEMFEMAAQGAKVLQARSVELAMKHKVNLRVLSSFIKSEGTYITSERNPVESTVISGIAHNQNEAKITLLNVPGDARNIALIFGKLAENLISVDMIVQSSLPDNKMDLTFTLLRSDLDRALPVLEEIKKNLNFSEIIVDNEIVKISVIGIGMKSNMEIASILFKTLAEHNIHIQLISTSEIKISVIIGQHYTPLAVTALHTAFSLDEKKI
ncbi:MAG: aspartate kinase [Alphaproteobacteria bacterium]|nr:aspartate kinase [Alphaproteobacteria bacterium]